MSNKRTYPQGDIHTPGYYLQHMNPGFPASSEIYCAQYPMPGIITSPYSSGVFSGGSHDSKSLSIPISAGTYGAKNNFEDWAAEHERGAEVEAAILAQEGHHCLLRPEYQFQNHEPNIGTPLLFENSNLSPFEASPTLSSESPGSDLNHEGPSTKRHKCSNADCSYTSSRRDHVNDHYRAHHLHMPYKCDACGCTKVYKGDFASHSPCKSQEKNVPIECESCGATVHKRGLKRHKETKKCKTHHLSRPMD